MLCMRAHGTNPYMSGPFVVRWACSSIKYSSDFLVGGIFLFFGASLGFMLSVKISKDRFLHSLRLVKLEIPTTAGR